MRRPIYLVVVLCGVAGIWFWANARHGQDADGTKSPAVAPPSRRASEPESAQTDQATRTQTEPVKSSTPSRRAVNAKAKNYEAIWKRLDTNAAKPKPPAQPVKPVAKPEPPAALPPGLRLRGTIVEDDGAYAVLEDGAGKQHLLEEGDSIKGIMIEAVHDDHVELTIGGKTAKLYPISEREQSKAKPRLPKPARRR